MHIRSIVLSIVSLWLISSYCYSQSQAYQEAIDKFKQHYNQGDSQAVYELFAPSMQNQLTLEVTQNVVKSFEQRFGALKSFSFLKYDGKVWIHKMSGEHAPYDYKGDGVIYEMEDLEEFRKYLKGDNKP